MRLKTLEGEATRPTLERVKEAMFSSVQFLVPGARVLDLFAGSGQLGLEALSRGADSCVFIDSSREAADLIIENARVLGLFEKCRVACMDAATYLAQAKDCFDLVLLDPPYRSGMLHALLAGMAPVLASGAVVLCESGAEEDLPPAAAGLALQKKYRYGQVFVGKYRQQAPGA